MKDNIFKYILMALMLAVLPLAGWLYDSQATNAAQPEIAFEHNGVLVLCYHKVDNVHISLAIPLASFEKQMKWLNERGYNSITPEQLYDFISNGEELPENPVLITFDDGYVDNYKNAAPIMEKYGYKGTIFVVTSYLGKYPNYMNWEQAKDLVNRGFNIESHTKTHRSMTELSDDELKNELEQSRQDIEANTGKEASFVAYPTGTYNLHIAQLVKDAGYHGAFTIKFDNVDRNSNVFAMERVPVFQTNSTDKDFLQRLQYIPLYEKLGWSKN